MGLGGRLKHTLKEEWANFKDQAFDDWDNPRRERIAYEDRHERQLQDPRNPQYPRRGRRHHDHHHPRDDHEDNQALIREQDREDRRRGREIKMAYDLGVAETGRYYERRRGDEWKMKSQRQEHLRGQERRRHEVESRRMREEGRRREEEAWYINPLIEF